MIDSARLYSALLNTGLQTKDNALYQVIYNLIGAVVQQQKVASAAVSSGGGTIIIDIPASPVFFDEGLGSDSDSLMFAFGSSQFWQKTANGIYYNDGNVGIGTNDPTVNLQVGDITDTITNAIRVVADGTAGANVVLASLVNGVVEQTISILSNTGELSFGVNPASFSTADLSAAAIVTFLQSGFVGIGTTLPEAKLSFGDTGAIPNTAGSKFIVFDNGAKSWGIGLTLYSGLYGLGIFANNTFTDSPRLIVQEDGNVGIGINTPTPYKLSVNGTTNLLDTLNLNGANAGIWTWTASAPSRMIMRSASAYGLALESNNTASSGIFIASSGNVGIGLLTVTAYIHIKAGTATANTAPLKFTTGTNLTTAEVGTHEYNNNHYITNWKLLRYPLGGTLFDHFADAGNGTTVETDLYSDTTIANTFGNNGDKIKAEYGGVFVSSATATREIKIYFAGTAIFDTGALTLSLSAAWTVFVTIIRVSSTVVRYMFSFTTEGAALAAYTAVGELTGLTLSNTNILKITGQAAGAGAATNDIVAKMGTVKFEPAA